MALVKLFGSGLYHLQYCSQSLEMSVLSPLKLLKTEVRLESAIPGCDEGKTGKSRKSSVIILVANLDGKNMHSHVLLFKGSLLHMKASEICKLKSYKFLQYLCTQSVLFHKAKSLYDNLMTRSTTIFYHCCT